MKSSETDTGDILMAGFIAVIVLVLTTLLSSSVASCCTTHSQQTFWEKMIVAHGCGRFVDAGGGYTEFEWVNACE